MGLAKWDYTLGLALSLGLLLARAGRAGEGLGAPAGGALAWLAVQSDSLALSLIHISEPTRLALI
eukprot:10705813-Alexandrium_andersonii.AAC.1